MTSGRFFSESPRGVCDKQLSPFLAPQENDLSPEMYVRWVQLGAFQPFERLHSHHGRRLPWEYPEPAYGIAADFLRLRGSLVPYLYTLAREAHDRGLPMVRALYLQWPRRAAAYRHPTEYTLGRDVLVAPVAAPGDPAETTVWFPPGTWTDWFTGERYRGPATKKLEVPLERMPVFVRAGGLVPTLPPGGHDARRASAHAWSSPPIAARAGCVSTTTPATAWPSSAGASAGPR